MKTQLVLFLTGISLLLAGCSSPQPSRNYGLRQEVGIDSYPQHARVYIDGKYVGKTPLSAQLKANRTYEVVFEKSGYKPYVEYVGPDLDMKLDPLIKIGPLESQGMYNRLGPNPLQVEMEHELVPDIAGPDLLKGMLVKTEQLDNHLAEGLISIEEHRYVTRQILEYFKDESIRRGNPILVDEEPTPPPPPAFSTSNNAVQRNPAIPTNPTPSSTNSAEVNLGTIDLDSLELDDISLDPTPTPMPTTTVPDLGSIQLENSGTQVPVDSPQTTPQQAPMPTDFQTVPTPGAPLPQPTSPPPSSGGGGLLDFGF
jgi:hypothetical protein